MNNDFRTQISAALLALLIWGLAQPSGLVWAFTQAGEQSLPAAEVSEAAAPAAAEGAVLFLGWDGNRLKTTAGVFLVDDSVRVIDKAGSRDLPAGFSGPPPKVELIYERRRLTAIIIE